MQYTSPCDQTPGAKKEAHATCDDSSPSWLASASFPTGDVVLSANGIFGAGTCRVCDILYLDRFLERLKCFSFSQSLLSFEASNCAPMSVSEAGVRCTVDDGGCLSTICQTNSPDNPTRLSRMLDMQQDWVWGQYVPNARSILQNVHPFSKDSPSGEEG